MKIDVPPRVQFNKQPTVTEESYDFKNLQVTQQDADKMSFDACELVENLIYNKQNASVRRGIKTLGTISGIMNIGIYETDDENKMMGAVNTGTDTTIVEINKTNAYTTDKVTGISGQVGCNFATMNSVFYLANGVDNLIEWDGSSDYSVSLPSGKPYLIESDGSRIWATSGSILYFSQKPTTGRVTSFSISGSGMDRAGIASSTITDFRALASAGDYIAAAGNNKIEGHRVPKPSDGLDTFPAELSTLMWKVDNIDVLSRHDMVGIGNDLYVKSKDKNLYKINATSGKKTPIFTNSGQFDDYEFDLTSLVKDNLKGLLYISGRDKAKNNVVFCYNIEYNNFSIFPKLYVKQFISDNSNIFYLSNDQKIVKAFDKSYVNDDGRGIDCKILSGKTYARSKKNLKDAELVYLNVRTWGDIDVTYKFLADKGIESLNSTAAFEKTYSFSVDEYDLIDGLISGYDLGIWGGAGFGFNTILNTKEYLKNEDMIDEIFYRGQVEITFSARNKFELRGFGFSSIITTIPVFDKTYS